MSFLADDIKRGTLLRLIFLGHNKNIKFFDIDIEAFLVLDVKLHMDLIVAKFGARLRRQGEQIVVQVPGRGGARKYPARRVNRILIIGKSSISADAVRLAMKHGIDVAYIGRFGKPEARIVPSSPTGFTGVRHAQLHSAFTGKSLEYAKRFVSGKIANQRLMAAVAAEESASGTRPLKIIADSMKRAARARDIGSLMSAEGCAAAKYFSCAWHKVFKRGGRKPGGKDRVNAALNYGYGILYNEVERAVLFSGLDPFIGMLHSERYGKPSLVLDMVEEFRVSVIDSTVLPLFANRLFEKRDFTRQGRRYLMGERGRRKIVNEVFARLNERVPWKGSRRKLSDIITFQAQEFARALIGRVKSYEPFLAQRLMYEKSISSDRSLVAVPKR